MINEYESNDEEQECTCRRCGSPDCDGLKNCDICGEDTECDKALCLNCDKALCLNCEKQEQIDEITSHPDFDPSYYRA